MPTNDQPAPGPRGGQLSYATVLDPTDEALQPISQGLDRYNVAAIGPYDYARLAVFASDGGTVIGGIYGELLWEWLYIQSLWVEPAYRGRGIGTTLLHNAEATAQARGITKPNLETTSFQALDFYRKRGYEVFGQLDGKPRGVRWYYLKKEGCGLASSGDGGV
jgi:GNAT superfamily N-acetyltransferase